MDVHICIPVLRRYDLLQRLLLSLPASTLKPTSVQIIDNGHNYLKVSAAASALQGLCPWDVFEPKIPMGVAESWNWFIKNVPEDRIITNDDIVFAPHSLERMVSAPADLVWGLGFSCFLMRESCIAKVGLFDEAISPGYAYFEDEDMLERLRLVPAACVDIREAVNLIHGVNGDMSQTWKAGTPEEISEHWRLFTIAKGNFVKKWGAEPHVLRERRAMVMG